MILPLMKALLSGRRSLYALALLTVCLAVLVILLSPAPMEIPGLIDIEGGNEREDIEYNLRNHRQLMMASGTARVIDGRPILELRELRLLVTNPSAWPTAAIGRRFGFMVRSQ